MLVRVPPAGAAVRIKHHLQETKTAAGANNRVKDTAGRRQHKVQIIEEQDVALTFCSILPSPSEL